jgi:malic enzyme
MTPPSVLQQAGKNPAWIARIFQASHAATTEENSAEREARVKNPEIRFERTADGKYKARVRIRGRTLLSQCVVNKGTAFDQSERRALELEGLLPHAVTNQGVQAERALLGIRRKEDPLEQYIGMAALQDRNETLFYRVLLDNIAELMPIVYTPTVGAACQNYSSIFRRGRGMWITPAHRGRIREVLQNAMFSDVRLIVVTDNERILGLGDQGAGGMGIPIGKLSLYTAAAGIHPSLTLPISLDVGTDNMALREDPVYIGWREPRLRGPKYDELVEEFIQAVIEVFPNALLQWEDFKKDNAFQLLARYRERLCSFNDDIQGTAAVTVAGVFAAARARNKQLKDERILIVGAGAAGAGIAHQLVTAFARVGVHGDELHRRLAIMNSKGLVIDDGVASNDDYKAALAWPRDLAKEHGLDASNAGDLLQVVRAIRPTILVGTTGQPGMFTEPILRAMLEYTERPVVFPLSNPTSKSEATPSDVITWTDGHALVATGSPFDPVVHKGRTHRTAQGNNVYIFPGIGLGVLVSRARRVSDSMFTIAAEVLASCLSSEALTSGTLFPPLAELRNVSKKIAEGVVRIAREEGIGDPIPDVDIPRAVEREMWEPEYPEIIPE